MIIDENQLRELKLLEEEKKRRADFTAAKAAALSVEPALKPLPDSTDIRERAKCVEDQIFDTYYHMMMDKNTPPAIRKSCADALADRARGKPAQSVDITNSTKIDNNINITITHVAPTHTKPRTVEGVVIPTPPQNILSYDVI